MGAPAKGRRSEQEERNGAFSRFQTDYLITRARNNQDESEKS
jgi:hypothetical protein